jgi:hypothetical protein
VKETLERKNSRVASGVPWLSSFLKLSTPTPPANSTDTLMLGQLTSHPYVNSQQKGGGKLHTVLDLSLTSLFLLHSLHRSLQVCGRAELAFLTNSGLWFGYLLGVFQMILWMFWDNPWTLTIGGAVVGYL